MSRTRLELLLDLKHSEAVHGETAARQSEDLRMITSKPSHANVDRHLKARIRGDGRSVIKSA